MKTLRKLEINPERLMKDEELKRLGGGYDPLCCTCILIDPPYTTQGYMIAGGPFACSYWCNYVNSGWTGAWVC